MKLVALLLVLTPWIFCQDSPRLGSVEGQLTDADLGKPLRGVDVLLVPVNSGGDSTANLRAKSQKDGKFFFPSVAPGSYFVTTDEEGVIYRHWKPSDPDIVARQFAVRRESALPACWPGRISLSNRLTRTICRFLLTLPFS